MRRRASGSDRERALGVQRSHLTAIVGAGVEVRGRVGAGGAHAPANGFERAGVEPAREFRAHVERDRSRSDAAQRDPCVLIAQDCRGIDDCEVAFDAMEPRVGAARGAQLGHDHFGHDLVGLKRGLHQVGKKLVRGNLALTTQAPHDNASAGRDQHRTVIRRRIGMGHAAADRAAIAHLHVADESGRLGQHRAVTRDKRVVQNFVVTRARPNPQRIAVFLHVGAPADAIEAEHDTRPHQPERHHRHQAHPAREQLDVLAAIGQKG